MDNDLQKESYKTYTSVIAILVLVGLGIWIYTNKDKSVNTEEMTPLQTTETEETDIPSVENDVSSPEVSNEELNTESSDVVKEFVVDGTNFAFNPSVINVKKGDKVKIVFKSTQGFHDFVVDEYGVATKQLRAPAEEVLEFTADKVGSFEYYCSVGSHRKMGMVGTLVVSE